ncbi:vWA domain-containing protein [Agromyces larvae]|uniref:VWA domain-containing protein n=1 Tax=Agromyces larvae TaxID=2929802 RepID=A0ABY4BW15_9MICO|nr:VWA domain-containing protein [Agromyces larvae]UOE43380.1 VWA domain-containing protein [Agromyces larvae]
MARLSIGADDLVDNPTPRVPVSLCLDTSSSMQGPPIQELVRGVSLFYDAIDEDEDAHDSAEINIVEFNSTAGLVHDFASIERLQRISSLTANGTTAMGAGVNLALDTLENRKATYSASGVLYYQPWLVLMTDGAPTDNIDLAARRVTDLVNAKKLTVFPIGIGPGADMRTLARFSPNRPPLRLDRLKFKEFFEWLSKSVSRVSRSTPGDAVKLDLEGLAGWAEL